MPDYVGAYVNANYALSQGSGEYLCLYHADDLYAPNMVRAQVSLAEGDPDIGAVFTMLRTIGLDGRPLSKDARRLPLELRGREVFGFDELFNATLSHGNFLPAPSAMMRRDALAAVGGFDEQRFRTSADLEMWLRIARRYKIGIVDEPLLEYRVQVQQYGTQYNRLRRSPAHFFIVMDHFLAMSEVRQNVRYRGLSAYEAERSVDFVRCGMNLLAQDEVAEGRARLEDGLGGTWRHPWALARLALGAGLWVCTRLGLGAPAGRLLSRVHQWRLRRMWRWTS
jgi:hypothetical protein